ncbi:MAG: hypothetical protein A2Y25_07975 [Candidatus Melainabacteria bacterium GWF2_37_15]|nr:MAG: hypothetical protein A2Y25_07975 [Candidatus Melainabacteria bacterium GWF2_37_15]
MLKLNANGGPQEDAYMNIKQQRQELALRILLNNLTSDYKSAGTAPQQDSIKSQIERLLSSMGDGKSLSDVTGQDQSIFNKNQAPTAQQIAGQALNKPAATAAPKADAAPKTGGGSGSSSINHAPIAELEQALSGEDLEWAKKINGGDDKLGYRSENEVLNTGLILYDLKDEFGMDGISEADWFKDGANSDKINWYDDTNGNGQIDDGDKNIDGDTSYLTPGGKYIDPSKASFLMEVESEQYGKVVISVGGDGNLNGADDAIMSMGGATAAKSAESGLKDVAAAKDTALPLNESGNVKFEVSACPICKGAGCPACTGQGVTPKEYDQMLAEKNGTPAKTTAAQKDTAAPKAAATEAKAIAKAPKVAQLAESNPVLGKMVDQVEDPHSLSDSNIKDLIAAIMLLINSHKAA